MDIVIENVIKDKLAKFRLPTYSSLSDKTRNRLIQLESYIQDNDERREELAKEIKKLSLTKVAISECKTNLISRKTIYNDETLNIYIELSILEQKDYLNEGKVKKLQEALNEINKQYNNILMSRVDSSVLKLQLKNYEREIEVLKRTNENMHTIIWEKDQIINNLKYNMSRTNTISIRKSVKD